MGEEGIKCASVFGPDGKPIVGTIAVTALNDGRNRVFIRAEIAQVLLELIVAARLAAPRARPVPRGVC